MQCGLLALLGTVMLLLGAVWWQGGNSESEWYLLGLSLVLFVVGTGWQLYRCREQTREAETYATRLTRYLDGASEGIVLIDRETRDWIYANQRAAELMGIARDNLSWEQFLRLLTPAERELARLNQAQLKRGEIDRMVVEHQIHPLVGGAPRTLEFTISHLDTDRESLLQVAIQDVSDRRHTLVQLQRQRDLYENLSETNQLIVRADNAQQLLDDICQITVKSGLMQHAWVGLLQDGVLQPVAQASHDPGSLQLLIDGLGLLSRDVPSYRVLEEDRPLLWNRISAHRLNSETQRLARLANLSSVAAFPLHRDGELIGNLTFYGWDEDFFDDEVMRTLAEMVGDIDFALSNIERRASLQIAHQIIESSPVVLMRWSLDPQRHILFASQNILRWGYHAADLQQRSLAELLVPEDQVRLDQVLNARSHDPSLVSGCRFRIINGIGEQRWIEAQINVRPPDALEPGYFEAVLRDVHLRKLNEDRLNIADAVLNTTREGVMVTDSDSRILQINPAFSEALGYQLHEVQGQTPKVFASGRHNAAFYREMWTQIDRDGHWSGEIYNRRRDGELVAEQLSISRVIDPDTQEARYVAVFADVSELKRSNAQLEYLAHTDPLTGLPNRPMLLSHLEQALAAAARSEKTVALLILDLDHFKDVNDSLGHASGDLLLQRVGERLRNHLRGGDLLARIGGDEFALVLSELDNRMQAAQVAQHLIELMSEPCRLTDDVEIRPGGSVGISVNLNGELVHSAEMFKQADSALYLAKSQGRGSFSFYSAELTEQARQRVELEVRLRYAIRNQQLELYYQPQVDLRSGRIVGAEALVRWNDPQRGLVRPDQFIPLAEQSGLIADLGEWVLREVCRQGRIWFDLGARDFVLAANVSALQLKTGELPELVGQILTQSGLPAEALELELTEGALMHDPEMAGAQLQRLRALGVGLALDDFGTGYSSLAYLKRFPIDVLKIDKSFVDGLPHSAEDSALVRSVVAMGQALGLTVLAEGVEDAVQREYLQELGCDRYQGYLCSRPVPAAEFEQQLLRPLLPQSAPVP